MKRRVNLLALLILSCLLAASFTVHGSEAKAEDLKIRGNWKAYRAMSSEGKPMCGITNVDQSGNEFYLKYFYGDPGLVGQLMKRTWRFPSVKDAINVPLTIGVDRNPLLSGNASGYTSTSGSGGSTYRTPVVSFRIGDEKADDILTEFSLAKNLWFRFDQGNEKPWVLDMDGSAVVAIVFKRCTTEMKALSKGNPPPATQPYDNAAPSTPTQPYADADTVPSSKPTATQGDFGGI